MTVRDAFGEAWSRVMAAPLVAGMAVTAADPGGLWGAIKEGLAMGGALRKANAMAGESALIDAVVADFQQSDARGAALDAVKAQAKGSDAETVSAGAIAELGAVAALVADKTPEEADAFRRWLRAVAQDVAEAGTEGGFLGFGGEKVSDRERAALAAIDAALVGEGDAA